MKGKKMSDREIVVLSAVRTAIGKFGGALKDIPPTELAAKVICQGVQRSGLSPSDIGHVVLEMLFIPKQRTCTYPVWPRCEEACQSARRHSH